MLNGNRLENISRRSFDSLQELRNLDLSSNDIKVQIFRSTQYIHKRFQIRYSNSNYEIVHRVIILFLSKAAKIYTSVEES